MEGGEPEHPANPMIMNAATRMETEGDRIAYFLRIFSMALPLASSSTSLSR